MHSSTFSSSRQVRRSSATRRQAQSHKVGGNDTMLVGPAAAGWRLLHTINVHLAMPRSEWVQDQQLR